MLKIEQVPDGPTAWTLRLEGSVIGPWVDELKRSCEAVLNESGVLTVDLAGVGFADRNGVELLRDLASHSVRLSNSSPLIAGLLEMENR